MVDKTQYANWLEKGREVLSIEIEGLETVREGLDDDFVRAVDMLACCTGRVVVTGIGKSGLVGRKIAATFSSTGTPAYFLHPVEGAHGDMGMIRPGDVVLAISNSGETDELNAILPSLKSLGASIIALTGGKTSTMARLADVTVLCKVPREACPLNLAPTASTTATLAVGDAMAACLIELKQFDAGDFKRCHPGGALGQHLSMKVAEIMHTGDLPVADANTPLSEALAVMSEGRLGFLAVTSEDGGLVGVVTDGDIRRLLTQGAPDLSAPVSTVMITSPRHVGPEQSAAEALDVMESIQITVLPIVDGGRLVGMIHLHDLLGKGSFKFSS